MAVGVDEVEAAVHAVVHDVLAVQAALVAQVPEEEEDISDSGTVTHCVMA